MLVSNQLISDFINDTTYCFFKKQINK